MARRTRRAKLRIGTEAEERAWRMAFAVGHDYLGDLRLVGITTDAAVTAAMRKAWKQHGRAFMAWWDSKPRQRDPHAFIRFGEP